MVIKGLGNVGHERIQLVKSRLEYLLDVYKIVFIKTEKEVAIDFIVENELFVQKLIFHKK